MEHTRRELIHAVQNAADSRTIAAMARALVPHDPDRQVTALVEIDSDLEPRMTALRAQLDVTAAEIAKLTSIRTALRGVMAEAMDAGAVKKVDLGYATVSLVKGRESMTVTDIDAVTDEFARLKREGDRVKALAHLKETGLVPSGFDFHRGDPYIQIRAKERVK